MYNAHADKIAWMVKNLGGWTYYVGGCVRDSYLDLPPKDIDLLVAGVHIDDLCASLSKIAKIDVVGKSFGVIKANFGDETVDIALPRTERSTGAGHRDFAVVYDPYLPVEQDLARRDFTMNAIAVNVLTGGVIDPFGGRDAILRRYIRVAGDPRQRFVEDPLRMMRAVRFSSTLGFELVPSTSLVIRQLSYLVASVAQERLGEEMSRLLMGKNAAKVLGQMNAYLGLMDYVIPEFEASVGFDQHNIHHQYAVDKHVLAAVKHGTERGASLRAMWSIFLHDIAKPKCFSMNETGGHFFNHEELGAMMATQILTRLKFSVEFTCDVAKIVAEHLRPQADATDRALRRYVAHMGGLVEDGFMCREADLAGHASQTAGPAVTIFENFRQRILTFKDITGFGEAKLALRGDEIARNFEVTGKAIGVLKRAATQAVIEGLVPNEKKAILAYLKLNPWLGTPLSKKLFGS